MIAVPSHEKRASSRHVEGAVGVESDHTYLFGSLTGSSEKVRFEAESRRWREKKTRRGLEWVQPRAVGALCALVVRARKNALRVRTRLPGFRQIPVILNSYYQLLAHDAKTPRH